jgi:adenylate cyclase
VGLALGVLGALCLALGLMVVRGRSHAGILRRRLEHASRELEHLQQSFARFAPAEVVEEIISQGVSTTPEKKEVTVLFADLKGFTAMSEDLDPAVLVKILNGYFRRMSHAVNEQRGHVSKFIGDGILALFGALEPNPWQSRDAVQAALGMRRGLAAYNAELAAEGLPTLAIGVGVHRGTVVAGVIGSDQLMEYTVIGATVNLASRVESLTRKHDVDVLVTESVRAHLDERFHLRALPPAEVKGVSQPVATFAVEGFAERAG